MRYARKGIVSSNLTPTAQNQKNPAGLNPRVQPNLYSMIQKEKILAAPFSALSAEETLRALETSETGLSEEEARSRLRAFGVNVIDGKKGATAGEILMRQFANPPILILLAASAASLALKNLEDVVLIILVVLVNVALGFYQEYKAEQALGHLKTYLEERVRVIRGEEEREIDVNELVPGDIVHLSAGNRVPADARIINARNLEVDEALLTGEALPVTKTSEPIPAALEPCDMKNMLFGGTLIFSGMAIAAVSATGARTELGMIAQSVSEISKDETPLQTAVKRLSWIIAGILLILISGVFFVGVAKGYSAREMFITAVAVVVGAVPSGLVIALTVILAVGVERLAKRNAIVRKLLAAETLGSTTVIVTDKTGTLTEGRMKLTEIIPEDSISAEDILALSTLNCDVFIENPRPSREQSHKKRMISGRPLEVSIAEAAFAKSIDMFALKVSLRASVLLPFNSTNKFSYVSADQSAYPAMPSVPYGKFFAFLGAPEVLLAMSTVSKERLAALTKFVEESAYSGKKVIGVAIKERVDGLDGEAAHDLDFVGFLLLEDPVRKEAIEMIKKTESFGIRIVIATGDHRGTAQHVAQQLGMRIAPQEILDGEHMHAMKDEELLARLETVKIFARISPKDKSRIVTLYRRKGEIVAMTGDGVNDAPSIKDADIGIALGTGVDVAKDVADLVLLDDNFRTIVAAIEEGRRMFSNIKKVVVYFLSSALDGVFLIGGSLLAGLPLPLSALQILWVNFFTDSMPAISFGFETHIDGAGARRRGKKYHRIFDREVSFLVLGIGTLSSALLLLLYWLLLSVFGLEATLVKSFIFALFATYALILAFSLRSLTRNITSYNPFSNVYLTGSVAFGVGLTMATLYLPALNKIFGTVPLPPAWLAGVFGFAIFNILLVELTKRAFTLLQKPAR